MDDITWPPKKPPVNKKTPKTEVKADVAALPEITPEPAAEETFPGIEPEVTHDDNSPAEKSAEIDAKIAASEPVKPISTEVKKPKLYFKKVHLSKKGWALVILVVLLMIGGGAYAAKYLYDSSRKVRYEAPQSSLAGKPKPKPKITTGPSPLTGVTVDLALTTRPVTGVMIENSLDARPQSGLKDAGIVYEAIAEGGITRFLALFQDARPDYIGPVRSVRPYYLDFLMPFNAAVAHVGGAPQGLADIKSLGVHDLDEFANAGSYWRIAQRFAPHNVYTNFDRLDALNAAKGFGYTAFSAFPRKKDAPAATPTAKTIDVAISGPIYDSHYDYDTVSNSYKRSEGGKIHIDERTAIQLAPKVVIALVMNRGIDGDGQHTDYTTSGSGHLFVFQDGLVTEGTWTKADRKSQFIFTDAAGKPLKLNAGQTWITLVDSVSKVTFK